MHSIETPHFLIENGRPRPRVPTQISNELADHIAAELAPLGLAPDASAFEQIFTETALATDPDPMRARRRYYGNTLRRLRRPARVRPDCAAPCARIDAHPLSLLRGRT